MAKKVYKTGEMFSVKVSENEYIFGRILFDPNLQYLKKVPKEKQFSYLDFFGRCFLVETYMGVFTSLSDVNFDKIAIKSSFISNRFFKEEKVEKLSNKPVNPIDVSFPEVLSIYNDVIYFTVGELRLQVPLSFEEFEKIKVRPSYGSGYWDVIATIMTSKREDLVEDKRDIKDNYFFDSDLRSLPDIREKIYSLLGESSEQSYYELALKHGFDLTRLY